MTVYKSVSELIGGTPLVELTNYEKNNDLDAIIVGKVESFNPAGSVKDRVAKAMIDDALASGKIDADTVLIEPTSGNTGIGFCPPPPPPAPRSQASAWPPSPPRAACA